MKKWNNTISLRFSFANSSISWHRLLCHFPISIGILFVFMVAFSVQSFSQTETFDIATYIPPKDFKKESKQGVVNYIHVNSTTGRFCVIAIYASRASTGDVQKDFNRDWKELVVTPYNAIANPNIETQTTAEGWKVVTGAAPVKLDGNDLYIVLSVVSGFEKTMSIRTALNDQSYITQVDALFETIKLDKTNTAIVNNNNPVKEKTTGSAGKFGLMIYKPPTGWSEQVFQDGVVFKPLDLPAEEHLAVHIMQPLNFSGSMEQALAKSYDEAIAMYKATKMHDVNGGNYSALQAKKSFRDWEYIRCSGGIKMGVGDYPPEYGLNLFVIKLNERFERVAILQSRKSCNLSRYYSADRLNYYNAIEEFLFSLQFTDWKEPPLKTSTIKGEGIVGVWEGISLSVGITSTSEPLGVGYRVYSPIFLSSGQAYFGSKFPSEGLNELNTFIRAENIRRDWGTYTFNNGKGILKMPYADIPLRMENGKLIITSNKTDHAFIKLNTVDGARFNGTYVMSEAYGKIPVITFTTDGKFIDNGAVKILYHEYIDCINPALTPGSGVYEVKDHSILFNYTDGRKIKIAFLGTGYDIKNHSPSILRMSNNEDEMRKQ